MKHFLSLERLDVGRTLAMTVGSPSAHRRGTMLKLLSVLAIILTIGVGQMWGADRTIIIDGSKLTSTATTGATTKKYGNSDKDSVTITFSDGAKLQSSNGDNKFTANAILIGKSGKYFYNSTAVPGTITKFELYANKGASAKVSVSVTFSKYPLTEAGTASSDTIYEATLSTLDNVYDCSGKIPTGAKYFYYKVTNANNSQVEVKITYTPASGSQEPSVSVKQGSTAIETLNVPAAGATNQTLTLEYANIKANSEGVTPSINFYSNAACTSASSQEWFTATGTNKTTVTYSAQTNTTGSTRSVYAVISNTVQNTAGTNKTVRDTITISQASLVLVTNISVKASTSLEVDATETLTATVTPDNASDKSVTWSSDDEAIATVDENGKVTGVAIGTTNIKATANDGSGVYGSCAVTVIAPLPKIIIDGVPLPSDATTQTSTIKFGNAQKDSISVVLSDGAKFQTSTNAVNHFGSQKSIFIGKTDKYIYNSTPIPGVLKKFELYANYGASTNVSVSVTFSRYPLTAAGTGSDTLYTATLSTLDNVYDCSAKIPEGAKYFYYKVTNANNSQVQFRITYEPITSPVTITAPTTGTGSLALANGQTAIANSDNIEAGTELTVTATPNGDNHYIGGTVTVTKTVGGDDVTAQVYNLTTGKITMPEYAITVSASFTPTYAITGASVTGGSFSWEDDQSNANPAYVAAGVYVQASANADAGYVFGGTFDIYKTGTHATVVTDEDGLFEMPAYAVTIGGSFNEAPTITLSQTSTMAFTKVATGASTSAKFTVSAANLTAGSLSVSKSGTNADKFGLSVSSIDVTDGAVSNAEVTVTPVTTATGDFTATITVDDGNDGAEAQSFDVTLHVEDDYTIQWYVNGTAEANKIKTQKAFANDNLDIPTASDLAPFTDCSEFIFLGWKDGSAIDGGSSTSAPALANVGTKVAASKNYYAVFGDGSPEVDESDSWDLTSTSAAWTGSNTETYFTKPYGMKKANAYIVNSSISDFENYANDADEISITVTCFQNGGTTSRLTVYLVDENGAIITGTGKEFTPTSGSGVSSAADSEVTYSASDVKDKDATGYMVKCTTYDKGILITGTSYQITKAENYEKYYTTCPQIKNVVLSAATVDHGSISFKVGGKAATNARTEEGDVVVDIVAAPETGYELTGISLSPLSGASYNSTTGKIELEQNTNGTLTVTATFSQKNYSIAVETYPENISGISLGGATSEAKYGVEQTISTNEPTGYLFGGWYIYDAEDTEKENDLSEEIFTGTYEGQDLELSASFLMPDKNLVAKAYFDKIYTVSEFAALSKTNEDKYVIEGLICNVESYANEKYITYHISDNGVNSGTTLKIYKGLGLNGASFSAATDLNVGERVRVYGAWDNSHTDIAQDNKLYYHQTLSVSSVTIDGSAEKTAYSPSDNTFSFAGLTATATYNTGYVKDVTGEATWTANSANPYTVAATGDVTVRATFGGQYDEETVGVTYTTKTVKSIYLEYESTYTFKGYDLPKPKVYAKYVESIADDEITSLVEAANGYDTESAYNKNTLGNYTINVGYESFNAEYTVQVRKIFDNEDAPHNVADATALIVASAYQSTTSSTDYMWVRGKVSSQTQYNSSYYISDDGTTTGQLYVFSGKYFNNVSFTADTKLLVGDEVIVKATILNYNGATPELTGSQVTYQLRDPAFAFADVVAGDEFEAGFSADMTVVPTSNEGEATFTLLSGNTDAVTIVDGKLHAVAEGDAEITASRAAMGESGEINYKAKNATFNVHVIAERTRYAITMDKNGGSGVDPVYENQLAGATVDLPATNTYSKANSAFAEWVVNDGAVEITDGHFTMPAAAVTIKATWNDVETCAISFMVSGSEVATADAPQTAAFSLAGISHPTVDGFTFIGWSETEYDDETTTLPTTITSYTPALNQESKTLYGIYSQVVGGASNLHYVLDYADENLGTNTNWGSYGSAYNYTAADGGAWVIKAYKNSGMQINTGKDASIKIPNCSGEIISISITCGAAKAVGLSASDYRGSGTITYIAEGTDATSQTLDLSGESVKGGYIVPKSGRTAITHIDVEYSGNVTYYTSSPITRYTITYAKGEATGVTGLCETQRKAAGSITLCDAPTCADKNFAKWSDGTSLYDAGAEYTLSADVTFTATWTAKPKYTVTYTANGGTGTAPEVEEYMEGETVTVLEDNTFFTNPGFVFDGWSVTYNDGEERVITPVENQFTMVANNVVIKAQWTEESKQKWALVTETSQLEAGAKYIIAAAGYDYAMAGQADNNRRQTAITKRGENGNDFLMGTSAMQIIMLEGEAGAWEFNTGEGYLYAASSSNNWLRTQETNDANGKWIITLADDTASITATGSNTRNKLRYNSSSSLFSCYGSGQKAVALYKEIPLTQITTASADKTQEAVPDGGDLVLGKDVTWTVTADKEVGDLHMNEGAIIANNNVKVETQDLYFKAKYGKSNQVIDASKLAVNGDFYYDYQLCEGTLDADYWYSIAVPFNVNLSDGVSLADGTPLTNGTDFEVWEYDTQKRAQTMSNGWKRVTSGKMEAGKAYLIGFNPGMPNTIRLKAAQGWQENLFSGNLITLESSTTGTQGDHDNWNGIANPKMRYTSVDQNVGIQVFNNNTHTFSGFDYSNTTFVVGLAFFVQSTGSLAIGNVDYGEGHYRAPQRASQDYAYSVQIKRQDATYFDNQMVVRASEDATNAYEQGHDMLTMNNATSNTAALLWTENYGGKRLAIEEAPLVNNQAMYNLRIYAPAAGTYSLSAAAKEGADLYVTYEGQIIWNLSLGDYELDLAKGTTTGYGLLLVVQPNQMPTGVENGELLNGENGVQKILLNGQLYILRDGHLYDAVGKEMK